MDRTGFTLTELLVVIAVIGILAALLSTGILRVKARAVRIQCVNNLRQQGLGLQAFVNDNQRYPLLIGVGDSWEAAVGGELGLAAHKRTGVLRCPAVFRWRVNMPTGTVENFIDYGYNGFGLSRIAQNNIGDEDSLGLGGHAAINENHDFSHGPAISPAEVINPSEMLGIGDGFAGKGGWILGLSGNLSRNTDWNGYQFQQYLNYDALTKQAYARHQRRANVVFCDGHVDAPMLKFLFEDTSDEALCCWNRDYLPHRERL
jgi:prepilin-type N-terminal cleavage/methylation domain-containing protein/prepilin-type processing-associated H-X9-DG protein